MNECPCETCITLAICQNKKLVPLVKSCIILRNFLVTRESSKGMVFSGEKLNSYYEVMKVKTKKMVGG